ncbi:MAG: Bax inhibitor-1 family protein [Gammaproteobacteria bacterium WSBS_2016_MAG_OTU1]
MIYSATATSKTVTQTNRVLRNAYLLLGVTMLPTIGGAFVGALYPLMQALGWMSLIVFIGAMFGMQTMIIRNKDSVTGIYWLLAFTFVMGYFIGPLVGYAVGLSNGTQIIATAIGGTAAIFFIMAGYATVTKHNLSTPSIGKMLFIGMWMLFTVAILNVFIDIPALSLAISSIVIVIASGFILYTVNNVVRGGEKNYILVTMTLYIMLLNIFQSLLHLLMIFSGNRD